MKKKRMWLAAFLGLFAAVMMFAFVACSEPSNKPEEKTVSSIAVSPSEASLMVGEDLNYGDFEITVTYSDKSEEKVKMTAAMISEDDKQRLTQVGAYDVTVNCMGKTAVLKVTVNAKEMNVTAEDVSVVYSGGEVVPTVNGAPENAKIEYAYYNGTEAIESNKVQSIVDAGTYLAQITVTAKDYKTAVLSVNVTVAKAAFDTELLTWNDTDKLYNGQEIALDATVSGLPEGITLKDFTANGEKQKISATDKGYYYATANFEGENKNYTIASCTVRWRILDASAVDFEPWFGIEGGKLIRAEFNGETGKMTFGGKTVDYTVVYDDAGNATVTAAGYTSVSVKSGVLRIATAEKTYSLLAWSTLNKFAGEYSTLAEDMTVAFDTDAGTAAFVTALKGQKSVSHALTLTLKDSEGAEDAVIAVDGTEMKLVYDEQKSLLKLEGYANPANFDLVEKSGIYLPKKVQAEEFAASLLIGSFVDNANANTLTVNADLSAEYNGVRVSVYCVIESDKCVGYFSYHSGSSYREMKLQPLDTYYKVGSNVFIAASYGKYIGTYYLKDDSGLHSDQKVIFMEYSGYIEVNYLGERYDFVKGELALAEKDGKLTATLTKADKETLTVTFDFASGTVSCGEKNFLLVKKLIEYAGWSDNKYVNGAGAAVSYDNNGGFTFGGEKASSFVIAKDANGTTVTLTMADQSTHTIAWSSDNRYLTVDGKDLYVFSDTESDADGRTAGETYYNKAGDSSIVFDGTYYTLSGAKLTDVVYSLVDDGNGRTVLQAKGKIGSEEYTIVHYSQAAVTVNGEVHAAETYLGLFGTEFKPTPESTSTFTFEENGKMMFRGKEVFVTNVASYTHFYQENDGKLYYFSFDVNGTFVKFNDSIEWEIRYYPSAYFEFNGAYISQDKTKVFFFGEDIVYYDETKTNSFSIMPTETGAKMTVDKKDAIFTSGAEPTLVYGGVTYTKVNNFSFNDYYRDYIVYDGSEGGRKITLKANGGYSDPKIEKLVTYGGDIALIISYNYGDKAYIVRNADAATSEALPYLAVQDKYMNLVGKSVTYNGKEFSVELSTKIKPSSTDLMPNVVVNYGGEKVDLVKNGYSGFKVTLAGVDYAVSLNDDAATQATLPLLIYELWWNDYTNKYTYNGVETVLAIKVGTVGTEDRAILSVTYGGEAVEAQFEKQNVGYLMKFALNGVNYVGVMNSSSSPKVAVYTQTEYDFFFASNTVDGKELVLTVENKYVSGGYATSFKLGGSSKYNAKDIVYAEYYKDSASLLFVTEEGSFAYGLNDKSVKTNVIDAEFLPMIGSEVKSVGYSDYSNPLYNITLKVKVASYDAASGKAVAKFYFNDNEVTKAEKTDYGYKFTGKDRYGSTEVVGYFRTENNFFADEECFLLVATHTVGAHTLVINHSSNGYTAQLDDKSAVSVKPNFNKDSFVLDTSGVTYIVKWEVKEGKITVTLTEVPAGALDMEGNGYAYTTMSTSYGQYYWLNVAFKGVNEQGKAEFTVGHRMGDSGKFTEVVGVLSDDGEYISATVKDVKVRIYKNAADYYTDFLMLQDTDGVVALLGKHASANGELVVKLTVKSKEKYDDYEEEDVFDGFYTPTLKVSLGGTVCTGVSAFKADMTEFEFTCNAKTYIAKAVDGQVTVEEKAVVAA